MSLQGPRTQAIILKNMPDIKSRIQIGKDVKPDAVIKK
jgi:hypothetical protein